MIEDEGSYFTTVHFQIADSYFKIEGRIVNKLEARSISTKGLKVEYIKNNISGGEDYSDHNSEFSILGIVTGIECRNKQINYITLTGSNPFSVKTNLLSS